MLVLLREAWTMKLKKAVLIPGKKHKHRMRKTNPNLPDMRFCTDKWCSRTVRIES